jgi:hypothetical protein
MAKPNQSNTAPSVDSTATPEVLTPEQIKAAAEKAANELLMAKFGPTQYSHETGSVTLYADKRRAGVKNGRAGHVTMAPVPGVAIQCSVYMDVETVSDGGKDALKKTYRFAVPKNVKVIFIDAAEEKKFKRLHLAAWLSARTVKQSVSDASGDEAGVSEIEPAAATA